MFVHVFAYQYSYKAKTRKCLVSGYPTAPNILEPTQTFLKPFGILKSIFRPFLYKKVFIKKKFAYLPTLNFLDKTYFFGLK